jgi:hypothetical protein
LRITVHNPDGVSRGVVRMTVNGKQVSGNLIVPGEEGQASAIEVWLGK